MFWKILAGIILFFVMLGFVRIRLYFAYLKSGMKLRFSVGPLGFQIFPAKKKKAKKAAKDNVPKEEPKAPKEPKDKEPFRLVKGDVSDILRCAKKILGRLRKLPRVDRLELCLTPGGGDAADIAFRYGLCNAIFGALLPTLERAIRVKKQRCEIRLDYDQEKALCYALVSASVSIGGVVCFGLGAVWTLLGFLIRHTKRKRRQTEETPETKPADAKAA